MRIINKQVLCKQPGRYMAWPSIAAAPNGDLLVVFSGDRDAHVSNDGNVQMIRSRDYGLTWCPAATVFDTGIDDRDSGILVTARGTVLVSWFTGPYGGPWQGHWSIRSTDNGHTWASPQRTSVTTPHGPIQLDDGRLLFIGQRPHCSHVSPGCENLVPSESPYQVSVEESRDDGQSWHPLSDFPIPPHEQMLSYDEPHLIERDDGMLIALFRDFNGDHFMRQSESVDGGATWAPPRSTPICGFPPHLLRLNDRRIIVSYAKRWPPYGIYACASSDGGATWDLDHEIRLSEAFDGDLGYPASVQLADGSIWTVYYQVDQLREKPSIMGTHWRLDT